MTREHSNLTCDLMIIGAGMAGMAAAIFAVNRGLDVVQVGLRGETDFASGLLDLMGVHPIEEGRLWADPWQAIDALVQDQPQHPYALAGRDSIRAAIDEFLAFLEQGGLSYHRETNRNALVLTPLGTLKPTYAVPSAAFNGVRAQSEKAACLIVDFHGLRGFSGAQIVESLKDVWPGLRAQRVRFPEEKSEWYPEFMARALEVPEVRTRLAEEIRPYLSGVDYVGLPAILGIHHPGQVFSDLQKRLGRPLFEIPTMPPSITGLRLRDTLERCLPERGVRAFYREEVLEAGYSPEEGLFRFRAGSERGEFVVRAKGAVLATGRFLGRGLRAGRERISETLFDLPVFQPAHRAEWHRKSFWDGRGHEVNRAGLETDGRFRVLGPGGQPAFSNLFAAGSILAHQDWMRMKCGSGLSIATAWAAVRAFASRDG